MFGTLLDIMVKQAEATEVTQGTGFPSRVLRLDRVRTVLDHLETVPVGNLSNVHVLTIGIEGAGADGVLYIDDIELHP